MAAKQVPVLTSNDGVEYHLIKPAEGFVALPLQHDKYFIIGPDTMYLALPLLIFSRARPEGIANANALMQEAAAGRLTRRNPISVRSRGDGRFQVIDGNSTAINALLSDWRDIPADVRSD